VKFLQILKINFGKNSIEYTIVFSYFCKYSILNIMKNELKNLNEDFIAVLRFSTLNNSVIIIDFDWII